MDGRVTIAVTDGVADVRLARGEKLNAIDGKMFDALAEAIAALSSRAELRAVVLSGEGRFCSGLDMAAMAGGELAGLDLAARSHGPANLVQQVAWGWRTLPVPVIAAVHGVVFGGATQIMGGADIRLAHPATRFAIARCIGASSPTWAASRCGTGCAGMCFANGSIPRANSTRPKRWRRGS
ncbi:hypothetical protein GCM10020258_17640 [Sphingomonas yabuuchiae]